MSSLSTATSDIESTKQNLGLAISKLRSAGDIHELAPNEKEAHKKLEEAHLLSIMTCPQCGMTNMEAREVLGMNDAAFNQHKRMCKFREGINRLKKWREEKATVLTRKENHEEYQFVCNLKRNMPFGSRLEECKEVLKGTDYESMFD